MDELKKKKAKALLHAVFHLIIPMFLVLQIMLFWKESLDNNASCEWNIFITVSCCGIGILFLFSAFFIEWILNTYFWQVINQFKEEK